MGHNLETRHYIMSMLCALRRVSVYSRSCIVQWELLQLGLTTLGTALALYYLMVCLSLLVVQEILLSTLVMVMVCTCLSVILTPWKVGVDLIQGVTPPSIKFSALGVIKAFAVHIMYNQQIIVMDMFVSSRLTLICRIPCHKDPV